MTHLSLTERKKMNFFVFRHIFFKFQDISTLNGLHNFWLYPRCTCSVPSPGFLRSEVLLSEEGTEQVRLRHSYGGAWTTQWFIHYAKPRVLPTTTEDISHYDWRYLPLGLNSCFTTTDHDGTPSFLSHRWLRDIWTSVCSSLFGYELIHHRLHRLTQILFYWLLD